MSIINLQLTDAQSCYTIISTSLPFLGKPEFHAEWLRDEPYDATATGSASSMPTARCQLPPGNGEHEIRIASCFCFR
jgi:hypothetical protein